MPLQTQQDTDKTVYLLPTEVVQTTQDVLTESLALFSANTSAVCAELSRAEIRERFQRCQLLSTYLLKTDEKAQRRNVLAKMKRHVRMAAFSHRADGHGCDLCATANTHTKFRKKYEEEYYNLDVFLKKTLQDPKLI